MAIAIVDSSEKLLQKSTADLRADAVKRSWASLIRYFQGANNGPEAKIAVVALGTDAKKHMAENGERALNKMLGKKLEEQKLLK